MTAAAAAPPNGVDTGVGSSGKPVLAVQDLSIRAGDRVLVHDVSFRMAAGERVGIIGASGSGKTLTAHAIAGLLPPNLVTGGRITLGAQPQNVLTLPEREMAALRGRATGVVFQEPMTALNPTMRIDRQVGEVIRLQQPGLTRRHVRQQVMEVLTAVRLPEPDRIARSYPHELSGGQRQRVALAIAIACDPALLICDEPTTALDVSVQARVLQLIDERTRASGAALLFISHDLAVVASLCDFLLVMDHGTVVERGPVAEVLRSPKHPRTQTLIRHSSRNSVRGRSRGDENEGGDGS